MGTPCSAMVPFRRGRRRSRRPGRWSSRRLSRLYAIINSIPSWALSTSTTKATSLVSARYGMCGRVASTCRWSNRIVVSKMSISADHVGRLPTIAVLNLNSPGRRDGLRRSLSLYCGERRNNGNKDKKSARAAHGRSYSVQVISGVAMATEELALIAGPAAEGTLFTFTADPRRNSGAASVVARFRAQNFEPAGYTLLSYTAVQVWAQAVDKAGSLELRGVIAALHSHKFDTVIGRIDFDDKGDLTNQSWVWYIFRGGEYVPLD